MADRTNKRQEPIFSERYDREDDVYYVTFKTGEPSCVIEHDDRLLVEVGVFTGRMTGFRILNFSKHKSAARGFKEWLQTAFEEARKEVERIEKTKSVGRDARESQLSEFLEKVVA